MLKNLEVLRMAQALASHAGMRQGLAAGNMANADTPGYRARDLAAFAEVYRATGPETGQRATRARHLSTGTGASFRTVEDPATTKPNGNTVSVEAEMMRAAEIRGQHDMAMAIYRSAAGVIRSSLGRG